MRKIPFLNMVLIIAALLAACVPANQPATPTEPPPPTSTVPPSPTETVMIPTETQAPGIGGESACPPAELPIPDWPYTCDTNLGFFFQYPPDAVMDTQQGTDVIRFNLSVLPGTNLGEKYVDVSTLTDVETCVSPLAAGYVPEAVGTEEVTIGGLTFVKQSGADAGAGNYYKWTAYSTARDNACVSFGFVLHSTNASNYPTPPPEFDEAAETAVFEQIVGTSRWVNPQ